MKRILALAGLLLILLVPAAFAEEGGFYLSLHGGGTFQEEMENESEDDKGTFNFKTDSGWLAGGAIGYDLRDDYPEIGTGRVELEVNLRENDLDEVEFSDGELSGTGTIRAESIMFNTIGELRDGLPWIPYIGLGAGAARLTLDQIETAGASVVDGEDTVFAYQGLVGVGLQVACRLYLDLGYRYFAVYDAKFKDAKGIKFDAEYAIHNVTLGMRLDF